jgi:hypothetical protein
MAATLTTTEHICDVGFHPFRGELMEVRTGNWLVAGDMVCVMATCAEHAADVGGHPRPWWEEWLAGEGATYGYTSLS